MDDRHDFIDGLGALVLDHRFKRMSQRLLDEARDLYAAAGLEFEPRWVSTYLLLEARPGMAVGQIAERLRISHPAVIQIAEAMREADLVESVRDPIDGRRRLLSLTPRATAMADALRSVWDALAREQAALFTAAGVDILRALQRVERELASRSLRDRVLSGAPAGTSNTPRKESN